jgi:hypothetical protein
MFTLRFFAGPIERRTSPLGLLFGCAVIAALGLVLLSNAVGVLLCLLAVTVYGVGKTFFWPTMLAVVSERFPKGGALTLGAVGGIGMLSAGLLGVPGIGFQQDHYAAKDLKQESPETYKRYATEEPNTFLWVFHARGLEGTKVGLLELYSKKFTNQDEAHQIAQQLSKLSEGDRQFRSLTRQLKDKEQAAKDAGDELEKTVANLRTGGSEQKAIAEWWQTVAKEHAREDSKPVEEANLFGGRMALFLTAFVPATMAVLYLLLILYFRGKGGYKKIDLAGAGVSTKGSGWTDEA